MRLMTIYVLAVTVTAVGCSRSDTAGAPRSALVAPASAEASRDGNPVVVATAGRTAAPVAAAAAVREVTIPAGTTLSIVLDTPVGSETSRIEESVTAHLARAVQVNGETVLAEGSRVAGVVTDAKQQPGQPRRFAKAAQFQHTLASEYERFRPQAAMNKPRGMSRLQRQR